MKTEKGEVALENTLNPKVVAVYQGFLSYLSKISTFGDFFSSFLHS